MNNNKENLLGVLIEAGISSRRKLAAAILEGRVTVNGQKATNLRQPLERENALITIDGQLVKLTAEKHIYLMLNKPADLLSTVKDEMGRLTVLDIIPQKYRRSRLYPVGRLDRDTTGLLLLTNDGELTNRLTHPGFESEKEYYFQIEGNLTPGEKRRLETGIRLEDGQTAPAKVREIKTEPPFNYSITIHEGRNRQVRRMLHALGHDTLALKRVRVSNLKLGTLKEGQVRELRGEEVRQLSKSS